ncbi:MAG: homoserine kinase [Rhodanobacteraceae bacterium]
MSAVPATEPAAIARTLARAFAPASVGNVGVGFDILGHTLAGAGDWAEVRAVDAPGVRITDITGSPVELPREAERNTAGAALLALRAALRLPFGFELTLKKGIALGSGMGGSAASSVAALTAANALLDVSLAPEALYRFALDGEVVASGGRHGDNVGPMLLGGLVLATDGQLVRIPVPHDWYCALVHPHYVLETRRARAALAGSYALSEFVAQSGNLAMLLAGCWRGDASLVRAGLNDVLVEPRRASLVHGFARVKQAAMDHHALGASISGGGPSVFGWFEHRADAEAAATGMQAAFADAGFASDRFVARIDGPAATLMDSLGVPA